MLRRATPRDGAPAKEAGSNVLERGQLRMDPERHSCTWKNEPVTLTVTEFLILQALASRPGVVKSRNALMDAAYDDEEYVDDRTIDSHIKRLRIKFRANDVEFDMVERFTALAIVSKKYERRLAGNPLVAGPLAVVDPSSVRGLGREGTGDDCCSD